MQIQSNGGRKMAAVNLLCLPV